MFFFKKKSSFPENLVTIQKQLKQSSHQSPPRWDSLSKAEEKLLQQLQKACQPFNQNNVTRTKAYLDFYQRFPEIHWAFLGHMVSRNGGWNMTDLKGEFLSRLMNDVNAKDFFAFLERGNWLIFQDVFPQFLLYEESVKRNQNLFYLIPYLGVSKFMEVIWNHFWETKDCYILTMALIINEQSYLEKRVIQNPKFKGRVLETIPFKLQDLLTFNQILFPYQESEGVRQNAKLLGLSLHYFSHLHERIILGRRLYQILYSDKKQFSKVYLWSVNHPHTGSRKDYWPEIFHDIKERSAGLNRTLQLKDCQLKKGEPKIYSPQLMHSWKNIVQPNAEEGDWFTDVSVVEYLKKGEEEVNGDIQREYCKTLETLELATFAKNALF
ncbi:DUF2515 family protein [Cytobacillus sp. Hz8]|uniref:DUF2515 family protein n=1 Tax=Cytobacillus sp. Hz8 TaxID=3347168 RepID=UPI0035DB4416